VLFHFFCFDVNCIVRFLLLQFCPSACYIIALCLKLLSTSSAVYTPLVALSSLISSRASRLARYIRLEKDVLSENTSSNEAPPGEFD